MCPRAYDTRVATGQKVTVANVAEEVQEEDSPTRETSNEVRPRLRMITLFFGVLMVLGGIVTGVVYHAHGGTDDPSRTNISSQGMDEGETSPAVSPVAPSPAPFSLVPVDSLLDELGPSIAPTDADLVILLNDPTSPQAQALLWLQSDSITRTLGRSIKTVLERYALAVLRYSTSGESSWSFPFMNSDDVCTWQKGDRGVACGSDQNTVVKWNLSDLSMKGGIPWELVLLSNLESINFSRNDLTGTIPSRISELKYLKVIMGIYNALTGALPRAFSPVTEGIRVASNRFTGTIPASWGTTMPALLYVSIDNNQLTGTFPTTFGKLAALADLELHGNLLTGTIPSELGHLSSLKRLSIHRNGFTGSVNDTLCNLNGSDYDLLETDCDEVACSCCTWCCYGIGIDCSPVV